MILKIISNSLTSAWSIWTDSWILSHLDAISFPFNLFRWSTTKAARIDRSTGTSFSKFWQILTKLQSKKQATSVWGKIPHTYCSLQLDYICPILEKKPAIILCERKTIKWAAKVAIKESYCQGKKKRVRKKNWEKSKFWLIGMRENKKNPCLITSTENYALMLETLF